MREKVRFVRSLKVCFSSIRKATQLVRCESLSIDNRCTSFFQQITSAIVHPHCVYLEQSEGLFSAGSILGERLPEEDVRVVETADNPHQQDVPVLPGAQRRKLYFNPAYFDRQLLLVSCLMGRGRWKKVAYLLICASHPREFNVFELSNVLLMAPLKVYSIRLRLLDQRQDNLKTAWHFFRPHLRPLSSSCSKSEKSFPSPSTRWLRRDSFLLSTVSTFFFQKWIYHILGNKCNDRAIFIIICKRYLKCY